jgi:hypothetical protein
METPRKIPDIDPEVTDDYLSLNDGDCEVSARSFDPDLIVIK